MAGFAVARQPPRLGQRRAIGPTAMDREELDADQIRNSPRSAVLSREDAGSQILSV